MSHGRGSRCSAHPPPVAARQHVVPGPSRWMYATSSETTPIPLANPHADRRAALDEKRSLFRSRRVHGVGVTLGVVDQQPTEQRAPDRATEHDQHRDHEQHDRGKDDAPSGHAGIVTRTLSSSAPAARTRGTPMERFVVISADCHAVGRPEDFTPYLEGEYRDAYAASQDVRADFAAGRGTASED